MTKRALYARDQSSYDSPGWRDFFVLAAIAAIHALWAFGLRWPARNERDLVAFVIGATGRTQMPCT
jgi:hypothetical protein